MADPDKIVFLSSSDFQLGEVTFKAGLYRVQRGSMRSVPCGKRSAADCGGIQEGKRIRSRIPH